MNLLGVFHETVLNLAVCVNERNGRGSAACATLVVGWSTLAVLHWVARLDDHLAATKATLVPYSACVRWADPTTSLLSEV